MRTGERRRGGRSASQTPRTRLWGLLGGGGAAIAVAVVVIVVFALGSSADEEGVTGEAQLVPVGAHALGAPDAPVTLVEFSNFKCLACGVFALDAAPKIISEYVNTGKVRFVYRHVAWDGESEAAAEAVDCAADQGRFKEYYDVLFINLLSENPVPYTVENLKGFAARMGLDPNAFGACLVSGEHALHIQQEREAAAAVGVAYTPTVFINGVKIVGASDYEVYTEVIERELAEAK